MPLAQKPPGFCRPEIVPGVLNFVAKRVLLRRIGAVIGCKDEDRVFFVTEVVHHVKKFTDASVNLSISEFISYSP